MVAALPSLERDKVVDAIQFDKASQLRQRWRALADIADFNVEPEGYLTELAKAGRTGTLLMVNQLLEDG